MTEALPPASRNSRSELADGCPRPARADARSEPEPGPRRLSSEQVFCGRIEVVIDHAGTQYRLRVTRQNKLILTK